MNITKRVRISTGLTCNVRCTFCYYNDELNTQDYTSEQIRRMLDIAREYGIRDIDFSGGEPTLRKDLPELIAYARTSGFRQICVITNGTRTGDSVVFRSLADAGLNEILVSIHGHTAATHNALVHGSDPFPKVLATLEHANSLGIRLRTNTVVNKLNYSNLPDIAKLIARFRPVASNFICFNDWVHAATVTDRIAVRYSEVAHLLKQSIDYLNDFVPKVTVRYIPFCFMEGYERHVCNLSQNLYDTDEWIDSVKRLVTDLDSPRLQNYFSSLNESWQRYAEELIPLLDPDDVALVRARGDRPFDTFDPSLAVIAHVVENHAKRHTYVKSPACMQCSRDKICDGLEKAYADINTTEELVIVGGNAINDAMWFRRGYGC